MKVTATTLPTSRFRVAPKDEAPSPLPGELRSDVDTWARANRLPPIFHAPTSNLQALVTTSRTPQRR